MRPPASSYLTTRNKNHELQQTAIGALAAGLLGGISEPSLYGIHLRYKRIYPRMLVGCVVGGLLTGILGWSSGGVKTGAFAFTSLLTIPVFSPMWVYAIAIAAAFFTAMILVIISDYRTPEQKAEEEADRAQAEADLALEKARKAGTAVAAAPAAVAASARWRRHPGSHRRRHRPGGGHDRGPGRCEGQGVRLQGSR